MLLNYKKILYFFLSVVAFSQTLCLAIVERLNINNISPFSSEEDRYRQFAQEAIRKAGISERLTLEDPKSGGYGTVFFTPHYAIKISKGEYSLEDYTLDINLKKESDRLQAVKDKVARHPVEGFSLCLPEHIYKVYLDGRSRVLPFMETERVGYNIQIMPRVNNANSFLDAVFNCIRNRDAANLNIMKKFGEKMGQFHNGTLMRSSGDMDKAAIHGDFKADNIIMERNRRGEETFKLIDIAEVSIPTSILSGGGSLISDITRFVYSIANAESDRIANWQNGVTEILKSFYAGYVSKLPKDVCQKLMTKFFGADQNGNALASGSFNKDACLNQARRDIKFVIEDNFIGSSSLPDIQNMAFQHAYKAAYPNYRAQPVLPNVLRPNPVPVRPQPIFRPVAQPAPIVRPVAQPAPIVRPVAQPAPIFRPVAQPAPLNKKQVQAAKKAQQNAAKAAKKAAANAAKARKAAAKKVAQAQKAAANAAKKAAANAAKAAKAAAKARQLQAKKAAQAAKKANRRRV